MSQHSKFSSPIRNALSFPLPSNQARPSIVSVLFGLSSPTAILRKVAFIVVDSFYCMLVGWPSPHIAQKDYEVRLPFSADRYSASTVVRIFRVIRIRRALAHVIPDPILRNGVASWAIAMFTFSHGEHYARK